MQKPGPIVKAGRAGGGGPGRGGPNASDSPARHDPGLPRRVTAARSRGRERPLGGLPDLDMLVHRRFEVEIAADRGRIAERQDLRRPETADAVPAVDPE